MYTNTFFKLFLTIIFTFLINFENVQSESTLCFQAPNICPNENVTFWLYTKNDQQGGIELNIHNFEKLNEQLENKEKKIKILIHGYTSNRNDAFNTAVREALFQFDDYYAISVNWTPLTKKGCRDVSALNTRVVGNCTANFIEKMIQYAGISLDKIHVIGFSLGAQTAGFISPNMKDGKIVERVSGLDPTLPNYNTPDISQRLDSSDGRSVDVYHTASGTRSQIVPCGHIDFYFNDAQDQPDCTEEDKNPDNPHICSHKRSFQYFAESINTKVGFYGHKCEFEDGLPLTSCDEETSILAGYHVPIGSHGVYQINTTPQSPFARGRNA